MIGSLKCMWAVVDNGLIIGDGGTQKIVVESDHTRVLVPEISEDIALYIVELHNGLLTRSWELLSPGRNME